VLNYLSSHDDGSPFDPDRSMPKKAGTYLLLAPGGAQIYYGDELARPLTYEGAEGDAHLRTYMNWDDLNGSDVYAHWSKLGKFRQAHVAVGTGIHRKITDDPYTFSRIYESDKVIIAMDVKDEIPVGDVFSEDLKVRDAYSGEIYTVTEGKIQVSGPQELVLLEPAEGI
jgi:alpha-amylase